MKIHKLEIRQFRGIRMLTLDLAGQNFAVYGPNGTGKSGIVDAIEFALTGSVSRLSGSGTGGVSVKAHAPHVISRDSPKDATVALTVQLPGLKKKVTITRSVGTPRKPTVSPDSKEARTALSRAEAHPEFVLSRRELIRYILAPPGDRAKEVQALLRLQDLERVRTALQSIANSKKKEVKVLDGERSGTRTQLAAGLGIAQLTLEEMRKAVNQRREILGLQELDEIGATTALTEGMVAAQEAETKKQGVSKPVALERISTLDSALTAIRSVENLAALTEARRRIAELAGNPTTGTALRRKNLLDTALELIEEEECPVCGTAWDIAALREVVRERLSSLESLVAEKLAIEVLLEPITTSLRAIPLVIQECVALVELTEDKITSTALTTFRDLCRTRASTLESILPFADSLASIDLLSDDPKEAVAELAALKKHVDALPDPTDEQAAYAFLTVCQERLGSYRSVSKRLESAQEESTLADMALEAFGTSSTSVLEGIYKDVQETFVRLYKLLNGDDEAGFQAKLEPSFGKLSFDVDFYGQGMFPPGAYHSEGHQDGMGLCLFLALMKHLLGDGFSIAVLDDVLMSVDSTHRREACKMLKSEFSDTQLILTTHDRVWLKHMETERLIGSHASVRFRSWSVDQGPAHWDHRDVWTELSETLRKDDVREAASLLRYYLEYVFREICHRLAAPVQFRADERYDLGDFLPNAMGRFRSLLKEADKVAKSWDRKADRDAIAKQSKDFDVCMKQAELERWILNPSIHFNEWAQMSSKELTAVVAAHKTLVDFFRCTTEGCGLLYLQPLRGSKEALRCRCGNTNFNLAKKRATATR